MNNFIKTREDISENGICRCKYESNNNINIINFIYELQSNNFSISDIGVDNNQDMYERKLAPVYELNDFLSSCDYIINSLEYDGVKFTVNYNNNIIHIFIKDNELLIVSYDKPVYLEDLLKKNDFSMKL